MKLILEIQEAVAFNVPQGFHTCSNVLITYEPWSTYGVPPLMHINYLYYLTNRVWKMSYHKQHSHIMEVKLQQKVGRWKVHHIIEVLCHCVSNRGYTVVKQIEEERKHS